MRSVRLPAPTRVREWLATARSRRAYQCLLGGAAMFASSCCAATDGYFDSSWPPPPSSGGGHITLTPYSNITAKGMAIQTDGKIVLLMTTLSGTGANTGCIVRLNPDGSYDYSFGPAQNGRVCLDQFPTLPALNTNFGRHPLLPQSDGKIVVSGTFIDGTSNTLPFVLRLNADGSLDTSAAAGAGFLEFQFSATAGDSSGVVEAMVLQNNGSIVIAGYALQNPAVNSNYDMAVARFNPALQLDPGFNGNGREKIAFDLGAANNDYAYSVVVQTDGKIVLGGTAQSATPALVVKTAIARLNADGSIDEGFGEQGRFSFSVSDADPAVYALAVDANGRILELGVQSVISSTVISQYFLVSRVLGDGSNLDPAFGGTAAGYSGAPNGVALVSFSALLGATTEAAFAQDMVLQSDGRIVVAGEAQSSDSFSNTNSYAFAVARLMPDDGSLDPAFGINGCGLGRFGVSSDYYSDIASIAFAPGNHLMLAGDEEPTSNGGDEIGVARLNIDLIFWGGFEPPTNSSNH